MDFEDLNFSRRTTSCLKAARIRSLNDLCKVSRRELCSIRGFGRLSADEVENRLHEIGRKLKPSIEVGNIASYSVPTERNLEIFKQRICTHKTFIDIGRRFNIGPERTRQIVLHVGRQLRKFAKLVS